MQSAVAVQTPIWYIVEQRIPPSLEWVKLTTDCRDTEFRVTKYSATKDHYFRVRAANEFGVAEPSMPAMIRKKEGISGLLEEKWRGWVAEWLACWTQAQKGLGSNRSGDAVG